METQITDKLERLVSTKSYSSLSEEEKKYVSFYISQEEYHGFYEVLNGMTDCRLDGQKGLEPSNEVISNLQCAFKEKYPPFYLNFLKTPNKEFRIPFYQVAAAVFILAIGIFSLLPKNEKIIIEEDADDYLSEAEFNKYTQLDGFYFEMSQEVIEDDVTQSLMNMQF